MSRKLFVGVCLPLLVAIGCGVDTTKELKEEATWSSKPQSLGCNNDSAGCNNDAQCSQFAQCQTGGWVACSNGRCSGFQPQSYDIDCILKSSCNGSVNTGGSGGSPPGQSGTCGQVTPPPELLSHDANDANCNFAEGMRPNEDQYRAWLQVTADQPNSTVTVHSLSSYCLNSNGTITPIGGTAKGEATVTWAGHYRRDTWYNPSGPVTTVTLNGNNTYPVPNNPLLLHLGNGGLSYGCQYIVLKAVISTTGDARVELGLDGYVGNSWSHEIGVSGWKSCTTGQVTLVTPWGNNKTCDDIGGGSTPPPANNSCDGQANGMIEVFGGGTKLGECHGGQRQCSNGTWIVISQPVESTPEVCDGKDNDCDGAIDNGNVCGPLNNCPATGIKITPGPALLNPCPSLITKTWGMGGKQYTSAPGQPLIITDYWTGYAYFETVCNGQEGNWPPGVTNAQAGFAEVCTQGQNVMSNTFVCWDKYSSKYRPTVPLSPSGAGFCP